MAHIISMVNQKGGVGKTTSSVNLAWALALKGRKILVADMDPQGNASGALSADFNRPTIYEALCGRAPIESAIQKTALDSLRLIPSCPALAGFSAELFGQDSWEFLLKKRLKALDEDFDYIFIDSPPSLGPLTVNVLTASQSFIAPLQCEYYALEGLSRLVETVRRVKLKLNPNLVFRGILLTMFDSRNRLCRQIEAEVRSHFGDKALQTVIPRNVRLSEAPSFGQSIFQYDPRSKGAEKYKELALEFEKSEALRAEPIEGPPPSL